ncbi:unnamed protein product [Trifolium pratense]|uniref:Uncharacterized protein n=1 Tax=Trifolium pratense TaxID=57577 RepID=A0ACB0K0Z5_TRIPR|nr:unnamed protein product [Trifolium pratense]
MFGSSSSSSSSQHDHIMNNMFEDELLKANDEHYKMEFGGPSRQSDEQQPNQCLKKRNYRRHTQEQIEELDAFFKRNAHPDERERKELGRRLGLEPSQIKFWFQNRRTGLKVRSEREENELLKAEIEKLRAEMNRHKETPTTCNVCGIPATLVMSNEQQQLRLENALLRKELERFGAQKATNHADSYNNISSSVLNINQGASHSVDAGHGLVGNYNGAMNGIVGETYDGGSGIGSELARYSVPAQGLDDSKIVELAVVGMDELIRLDQTSGPPLWFPTNSLNEILNGEEYMLQFPRSIGPNPMKLRHDGSKESVVVFINPISLVDIFMDVSQWSNMFCGIVSRAATLNVLSTGVAGNYDGALQVMSAEFQVASPSIPTLEHYFVRYCKLLPNSIWVVADIPLDNFSPTSISRTKRRVSGCLIQELPHDYSNVTWIEHLEVEDKEVQTIYTPLINSGLAFGAKRWIAILQRQCERLVCSMSNNIPITGNIGVRMTNAGKESMLRLAGRMVTSFCTSIGASTAHAWTNLPSNGSEEIKVMTRKYMDESGSDRPSDVVLSTATSFWLPIPPKRVFEFLRNESSRSQWDILSTGCTVQDVAHIANGCDPGNCVSLLRVCSGNTSQSNRVVLQESCTDITGSYVVYAPVDVIAMNVVLCGGDSNCVTMIPSGFAILPDGGSIMNNGSGGSLITVGFQILVDSVPHTRLALGSVTTVNTLLKATVERIKVALMPK